jgi:hypothetical protein
MNRLSPPMGQKAFCMQNAAKNNEACESNMEKVQDNSPLSGDGKKEVKQLIKVRELFLAVDCLARQMRSNLLLANIIFRNWKRETAN